MEYKQVGGFSFIDEGKGDPLVLLHGLFGGISNFTTLLACFKKHNRVIIPQLPVYSLPILNTNVSALGEFLHKFLNFMKLDKVTLLGNSLGGHLGLVYCKKYPERVTRLVLTGSSGLYENAFGGTTPRKSDKEYLRKKIQVTFYDPAFATDELVDEVFSLVSDRSKLIRILALAKSAIRHNMASDLPGLTVRTCLIWGKNDIITPPEVADEFNRLMPNTDLFWIDKCGHAPMMEHPEEFNRILLEWLQKNPA